MVAKLIKTLVSGSEPIFHITPRFFKLIFELFMRKFDVFAKDWSLDQSNNSVQLQDLQCLNDMVSTIESIVDCIPEKWNRQAFDLIVGTSISDFVIETCLEVVKDQDLIDYERIQFNQETVFLQGKDQQNHSAKSGKGLKGSNPNEEVDAFLKEDLPLTIIEERNAGQQGQNFSRENHKGLIDAEFERVQSGKSLSEKYIEGNINLILRIIRLFNKSTREVYSNHLYLQMKKHIWYDKIGSYDFLAKSMGGLVFRKEILAMHSNFLIFHFNHIISDRMHHTSSTTIRDHELPEIYYQGDAFQLILYEIEMIIKLVITLQRENKKVEQRVTDSELCAALKIFNHDFVKKYVTDGVLKMLLKYVSGLKYVCFDEKILGTFSNQVNALSNALSLCYDDLLYILDTEKKEIRSDSKFN